MNAKFFLKLFLIWFIAISSVFAQQNDSIKVIDLEEVTVSAFRLESSMKELPHHVEVLQKKDIQQIPSESVTDLLKKTSGIDIVEYPGLKSNIGMRGFTATAYGNTYTLVLINGIPSGTQNPATIDINNAEQVEILKGPYSSFYGSGAMAGVVNIVTPVSRNELHGNVGVSYGSFQTLSIKANAGGSVTNKLNFDFSARLFSQNNDYKTGGNNLLNMTEREKKIMDEKSYDTTYNNTQYDKYNIGLRVGYDINDNWQVHLYQDLFVANDVYTHGSFWGIYGDMMKDMCRWSQNLNIKGTAGNHSIQFSPYFSNDNEDHFNEISDTNYVTNAYNYKTYGFILQDAYTIGIHKIIIGIDNYSQKYMTKRWFDRETQLAPYQPDYLNMATGTFFQTRSGLLNKKLNITLGGRFDYLSFKLLDTKYMEMENSFETYFSFNPNAGIKYSIMHGLNINASLGTAFLAPDAFKKTGRYSYTSDWGTSNYKGNPELEPEKSFTYDLGFFYANVQRGIWAGLTYFHTNHNGLIVYDRSIPDTISYMNSNKAMMDGVEISFAYDLGSLSGYRYSLKFYCNLTHLLNSEVQTEGITSDIKYVRKNKASFGIEFRNFKGISARLNGRYIGHRYEDNYIYITNYPSYERIPYTTSFGEPIRPDLINDDVLKHPDFLVFDLLYNVTVKKNYLVGLTVQNLFDENYTEKDSYYMPGRMIKGNFTFLF